MSRHNQAFNADSVMPSPFSQKHAKKSPPLLRRLTRRYVLQGNLRRMNKIYRIMLTALNSWLSIAFVLIYCLVSFYFGQAKEDMNIFAASGAVMTVFGLFSMIRFTTIEKYLNQEAIVAASTGVTGPPLTQEQSEKIQRESKERARVKISRELRSEMKGIIFTIAGTLIWAYGAYIPVIEICAGRT